MENRARRSMLSLVLSLTAASAGGEEVKPASHAKPVAAKPVAAKPVAAKPAAATAPAPSAVAMSQSKFVGVLYSEIARRTPHDKLPGPGAVSASFRVNAQGRVDKVDIIKATSPAHAAIVKQTLSQVEAPPPPGGIFEASQNFTFH